ncbi:hypothetical protein AB4142_31700, partial [Variovorax sp. 2RAF20]
MEIRLIQSAAIPLFIERLRHYPPPLARIDRLSVQPYAWPSPPQDFIIAETRQGRMMTQVAPDAATCPDCLEEVLHAGNRRSGYA